MSAHPSFITTATRTVTSVLVWCDECDYGSNGFVSPQEADRWARNHIAAVRHAAVPHA